MPKRKTNTVKLSISLSETVNQWAEELCQKKGYENFSAFVAELIRQKKETEDAAESQKLRGKYPPARRQSKAFVDDRAIDKPTRPELNETPNSTNPSAQQMAEKEADGIVAHVLSRSKRGKRKAVSPKRPNPLASSPPIGGKT